MSDKIEDSLGDWVSVRLLVVPDVEDLVSPSEGRAKLRREIFGPC
jgi:hypothetical protein